MTRLSSYHAALRLALHCRRGLRDVRRSRHRSDPQTRGERSFISRDVRLSCRGGCGQFRRIGSARGRRGSGFCHQRRGSRSVETRAYPVDRPDGGRADRVLRSELLLQTTAGRSSRKMEWASFGAGRRLPLGGNSGRGHADRSQTVGHSTMSWLKPSVGQQIDPPNGGQVNAFNSVSSSTTGRPQQPQGITRKDACLLR